MDESVILENISIVDRIVRIVHMSIILMILRIVLFVSDVLVSKINLTIS